MTEPIPGHAFERLPGVINGYVWSGCECNQLRKWAHHTEAEAQEAHERHLAQVRSGN